MENKCYALNLKTLEVKAYVNKKVAQGMGNGTALFTNMEELCENTNMSTDRILSAFNHNSGMFIKDSPTEKLESKDYSNLSRIHLSLRLIGTQANTMPSSVLKKLVMKWNFIKRKFQQLNLRKLPSLEVLLQAK